MKQEVVVNLQNHLFTKQVTLIRKDQSPKENVQFVAQPLWLLQSGKQDQVWTATHRQGGGANTKTQTCP